jgi:hypothetical protein
MPVRNTSSRVDFGRPSISEYPKNTAPRMSAKEPAMTARRQRLPADTAT